MERRHRSRRLATGLLATTAIVLTTGGVAYAQAAVGEVVVMARKRAESAQNIPVAVTVITGETMARQSISSVETIAASTPDLQVVRGASGSGANISVRGIGSTSTSSGIEQSVALNVDGVYYSSGRMLNEAMFDMGQVEILKGPQALFFGKNATAGVVSFRTNEPTRTFEAIARAGYEFKADYQYLEGIVSGPLTDTLSARLALRGSWMDKGYIENGGRAGVSQWLDVATGTLNVFPIPSPKKWYPSGENYQARVGLKWEPTDKLKLILRANKARDFQDNGTLGAMLYKCPVNGRPQGDPTSPVPCNRDWIGQNNDASAIPSSVNPYFGGRHNGRLYNLYKNSGVTLAIDYTFNSIDISNVTNYYQLTNVTFGDADATSLHQNIAAFENRTRAFSNELRFTSDFAGPVNFAAGIYYQKQTDSFWNTSAAGLPAATFGLPSGFVNTSNSALRGTPRSYLEYTGWEVRSATDGETVAPFAQVIWDITPELQFTAGARYTHETKKSQYRMPYVNPIWQAFVVQFDPANPAATQIIGDQTFDNTSPEAALTWRATKDVTVYGAYKEGYKSGGFSNSALFRLTTVPSDLIFNPETVSGFEGGVKSYLFGRSVRFDVTAYSYEYKNLQIDFLDLANVRYVTYNAGSSVSRGIEVQADWAPPTVPDLTLGFRFNYNDAHYKDFRFAPCYLGQTPAQGCTVGPVPSGGSRAFQDLSGHDTALAPEFSGALTADYTRKLTENVSMRLFLGARYSDSYNTIPFGNEDAATQKSYITLDGTISLFTPDNRWQVSLIGKNLTNEFVILGGQEVGGSGTGTAAGRPGDQSGYPNNPRTFELQVTAKF